MRCCVLILILSSLAAAQATIQGQASQKGQASVRLVTIGPNVVAITIAPLTASVSVGATQQFTATVTGSTNTAVTWSAGAGTVSASGLFTAPATAQSTTVTATSVADSTKSATATITVTPPGVVAITISPTTATLASQTSMQFTATVTGTTNTAVTWTAGAGQVTGGLYTAPPVTVNETDTVTATSSADPTKTATATVTVTPFVNPPPPANCTDVGVHCAQSCDQQQVASAVSAAIADTTPSVGGYSAVSVVLPVCTNTDPTNNTEGNVWPTLLGINGKAINFIGQGIAQTILISNLPVGSRIALLSFNNGNVDTTGFRISGFTIQENTNAVGTAGSAVPMIDITTGSHALRVDHIHFKQLGTHGQSPGVWGVGIGESEWGVVDHVVWTGGAPGGQARISHLQWGNTSDPNVANSDRSWSDPSTFGTNQAIFFEDTWDFLSGSQGKSYGCNLGARCVWRYNWITQIGSHGTDSSSRQRGVRQWEVYNNHFNCNAATGITNPIVYRGGTGFIYNNDVVLQTRTITSATSSLPTGVFIGDTVTTLASQCYGGTTGFGGPQTQVYRSFGSYYPWGGIPNLLLQNTGLGGCDGTAPYDNNDPHGLYDSGTIGQGSGGTLINDTSKNWTPNQYQGYVVRSLTTAGAFSRVARIFSNTQNQLTTDSQVTPSTANWIAGEPYEIRRVYDCVDSQGRGQSAYLPGTSLAAGFCQLPGQGIPTNWGCVGGGTTGYINHKVEPTYAWNNRKYNNNADIRTYYSDNNNTSTGGWSFFPNGFNNNALLSGNRDFYEQMSPTAGFNGTLGVGVGPVASRPPTCSPNVRTNPDGSIGPGVGWWDPSTNQLTVCTAPNTWSLYYTPYVYPHPLTAVALMSANGHIIETGDGHIAPPLHRQGKKTPQPKPKHRPKEHKK